MLTRYISLNYNEGKVRSKMPDFIVSFFSVDTFCNRLYTCRNYLKYLILSAVLFFFSISSHYLTYSLEVLCKFYINNNDYN